MNRYWLAVLLVIGALAGVVLSYTAWEKRIEHRGYERGRDEVLAQWNDANRKAVVQQHAVEVELEQTKQVALNEAIEREKNLRATVARVSAERDSLRSDLAASRAAIASASVPSLRARIAALTDVFEDCTGRYGAVAEKADRHAADSLMYQRAWPAPK